MRHFATFDRRKYRTVPAREGYAQWAATYDNTIKRDMDLWLLSKVKLTPRNQRAAGRAGFRRILRSDALGPARLSRLLCSRRVGRGEETEGFEDRKMGRPHRELFFCP